MPRSRNTFFLLKVLQVTPPSFPSPWQHLFHAASHRDDPEEAQEPRIAWGLEALGYFGFAEWVIWAWAFLIICYLVFIYCLSIISQSSIYPSFYLFFCCYKSNTKFIPWIVEFHVFYGVRNHCFWIPEHVHGPQKACCTYEQSLPIYFCLSISQPLTIADSLPVFVGLGTSFLKLC